MYPCSLQANRPLIGAAWTYLSLQDKTWAEFSTLDVGVLVYALPLHSLQKQPSLKWKTQTKQLLGYLPLAFVLPGFSNKFEITKCQKRFIEIALHAVNNLTRIKSKLSKLSKYYSLSLFQQK
jgi:hypothetical protein